MGAEEQSFAKREKVSFKMSQINKGSTNKVFALLLIPKLDLSHFVNDCLDTKCKYFSEIPIIISIFSFLQAFI